MTICISNRPITGHVYFLRIGDAIKIGYGRCPAQRLAQHRRDNEDLDVEFLFSVPGNFDRERRFHQRFGEYRMPNARNPRTTKPELFLIPEGVLLETRFFLSREEGFQSAEPVSDRVHCTVNIPCDVLERFMRVSRKKGFKSFQTAMTAALSDHLKSLGLPTIEEMEAGA